MNGVKLDKKLVIVELDDGNLQIVDLKKYEELDGEDFIMNQATPCKKCNRNFLLEYDY